MTDGARRSWFDAPGLTGESYYRTRRSDLTAVMTVCAGLIGALYAGVTEVMRLVGVRALGPAVSLSDYMVEVIFAAAVGAVAGAMVSWPVGAMWERWHRAQRGSAGAA